MKFFENWIEQDLNPIISFSNSGKILYSNQEAQFLLNRITPKEVYSLALKYAAASYGFNTAYVNLRLKNYIFYAISVSYDNDEEITIKLYKSTMVKKENKLSTKTGEIANIFTIVDLSISSQKTKSSINYMKNYDPSIPEFKMMVSDFLKLINKTYDSFTEAKVISTSVKLKIGEYIKIDGKKYSLITVEINSDGFLCDSYYSIEENFNNSSLIITAEEQKVQIDLPLILN